MSESEVPKEKQKQRTDESRQFHRIRFRPDGQEFTAVAKIANLRREDTVMIKTDHGLEPARVYGQAPVDAAQHGGRCMAVHGWCPEQARW